MLRAAAAHGSHSSFCEEVLSRLPHGIVAAPLCRGVPRGARRQSDVATAARNEVAPDEYSGSWLNLVPAFTAACATIGRGNSYPVTAAQLLPNVHGISRADPLIKLAKNCGEK